MHANINKIIETVAPFNNAYRDSSAPARIKIEMLWQIGDVLQKLQVKKPHSLGWEVQRETKQIIKRSTIIKGWKVRSIWSTKTGLFRDLGKIKSVSNLFEIFPLIDPAQEVRSKIPSKQLKEIYSEACRSNPKLFNAYISGIKKEYSHGRLGEPLNRERHLKELDGVVLRLRKVINYFKGIINDKNILKRDELRKNMPVQDIMAFSNMCIALTTKDNIRLYKRNWLPEALTNNEDMKFLYQFFYSLLEDKNDERRARLRRLVPAEILAQISDMLSSLKSEELIADFRERQKLAISL